MNHGIIIHPEDFEDLLKMDALEAGHIIQNVIKTHLGDENIVPFSDRYLIRVSKDMCDRVVRDKELYERKSRAGHLGGAPIGNSNRKQAEIKQKSSRKQAENKQTSSPNTKYQIPNTNNQINNKRPYGEFGNVYLTDEEYEKVKSNGWLELLEELSCYIDSKGDKYKKHYSTLVSWNSRRKKDKVKETQFTSGAKGADYDFEEILKRKVVN